MIDNKTEVTFYDFVRFKKAKNCFQGSCSKCELSSHNNGYHLDCSEFILRYPKEVNDMVLQWIEENPKRTRKSEFLEKFPNSNPIKICPQAMGDITKCPPMFCDNCKIKYWTEEVEYL